MSTLIVMLMALLLIATAGTMFAGVLSMGVGGAADDRNSTRLMFARVGLQGLTVAVILLLAFALKF